MQIKDDLIVREPSPWMTIQEAAEFLRVTEHTIHAWARAGKITKYRVAGFNTVRVKRADIQKLVEPLS